MATVSVLHRLFNETISEAVFPDNLKLADVAQAFKTDGPFDKKTTDLPEFYRLHLKFMKN